MKPPEWLKAEIASLGAQVLDGNMARADADAAIAAATREHPEFGADLGAAAGVRLLGKWIGGHASGGDLFQAGLFPDLPAMLTVAPKKKAAIADMTGLDLDHARNMLYARTENAIAGAEKAAKAEQRAFDAFYGKVRPLLTGGQTVGDVLGKLAVESAE